MKVLLDEKIGGDGGSVGVAADEGFLELRFRYPIVKILQPIKTNVVDKLKDLIPGTAYDGIVDKAYDALLGVLGVAPETPAEPTV